MPVWGYGMTSFRPSRDPNNLAFSPIAIDTTLAFEAPATRLGYDLWCKMANGRRMPDRRDLNPRDFGTYLPHLNLFDLHLQDGDLASMAPRVLGAKLEEVFGELTGKVLEETLPDYVLARWIGATKAALDHDAPVRATGRVAYEKKEHYSFEFMLGLMGDGDNVPAVLYAVASFDVSEPPAAS